MRQKDAFGYSRPRDGHRPAVREARMVRTLDDAEIARVLTYERLIPAMELPHTAYSSGKDTQPVRNVIPLEHGQRYLGVMPAMKSGLPPEFR